MPKNPRNPSKLPFESQLSLGGASLNFRVAGTQGALLPIVLEAGGGSILERWNLITERLEPHARVLSYERAGVGSSQGSGATPAEVAARLSALLESPMVKAHLQGPVIFVGHSLGGLYGRYFAATHPEKVAALVILDATPDNVDLPANQVRISGAMLWVAHLVARTGVVQWWLRRKPAKEDGRRDILAAGARAMARTRHVRTILKEIATIPAIQQAVIAKGLPKGIPILCISAGRRPRTQDKYVTPFRLSHDRLAEAGLPPLSRHDCIQDATHMGLVSDPAHAKTVADMILDLARGLSRPKSRRVRAGVSA